MLWKKLRPKVELVWQLISDTVDQFSRDHGDLLSAALAFYTLLSLAPLIIIAVAVAGAVLGQSTARDEITHLLRNAMGPNGADTVNGWVDEASQSGGIASAVGAVLLILAASRLASQLRNALNQIWHVDSSEDSSFKASIIEYFRERLFAFVAIAASGPLLLLIVASRALLTGLHEVLFAGSPVAGTLVQVSQLLFSLILVATMSAVVFKVVPHARVDWKSAWVGGILTSFLFNLGNFLVGLYLGRATVAATYGAAGSAVVVLLWLNFSAQFFFLGAEFTRVYARRFRSEMRSSPRQ